MHWSTYTIERELLARRQSPPDLAGAFDFAFATAVGQPGTPALDALHAAGLAVAAAMDAAAGAGGDLPYHGRHHAVDASLAMGLLCRAAVRRQIISPCDAACGIVAMAGHDIHHDGSAPGGGLLERQSHLAVAAIAAACGVAGADLATIGAVILATDPDCTADNAARFEGALAPGPLGVQRDVLNKLANEADICGSLLPRLGPLLGLALAEEWRILQDPALAEAATAAGRLAFLLAVPSLSEPAVRLGLDAGRAACLAAYAAVGAERGTATAAAGCALLDMLPPDEAARCYEAALCTAPLARPPSSP